MLLRLYSDDADNITQTSYDLVGSDAGFQSLLSEEVVYAGNTGVGLHVDLHFIVTDLPPPVDVLEAFNLQILPVAAGAQVLIYNFNQVVVSINSLNLCIQSELRLSLDRQTIVSIY